jgi:hypothetical protein
MLRLGQVLVGLVGIAALLISGLVAFVFVLFGFGTPPNPSSLPLAGLFIVLAVAMLVGTVAILGGSAWGAVLIALWTAGMLVWVLLRGNGPFPGTELVLAVATVLAIAVTIGMAREKSRNGESPALG